MIDHAAYTEMVVRCLLLDIEVQALRAHLGRHQTMDAERQIVAYLRDEERLTWPAIGIRLGVSGEAVRKRYRKRGM